MVQEAEKFKEQDEENAGKIQAKNEFRKILVFNSRNTVNDEKLKDKITDDDKQTILDKTEENIEMVRYTSRRKSRRIYIT